MASMTVASSPVVAVRSQPLPENHNSERAQGNWAKLKRHVQENQSGIQALTPSIPAPLSTSLVRAPQVMSPSGFALASCVNLQQLRALALSQTLRTISRMMQEMDAGVSSEQLRSHASSQLVSNPLNASDFVENLLRQRSTAAARTSDEKNSQAAPLASPFLAQPRRIVTMPMSSQLFRQLLASGRVQIIMIERV